MHTSLALGRVCTDSIAIRAAPSQVLGFLADARNVPAWAPGFAQAIEPAGENWSVTSGDRRLHVALDVAPGAGTVDLVAVADRRIGAFLRVLPNGEGAECLLSVGFAAGTPEAAVAAQMEVVATELETIRDLVEAGQEASP